MKSDCAIFLDSLVVDESVAAIVLIVERAEVLVFVLVICKSKTSELILEIP